MLAWVNIESQKVVCLNLHPIVFHRDIISGKNNEHIISHTYTPTLTHTCTNTRTAVPNVAGNAKVEHQVLHTPATSRKNQGAWTDGGVV